MRLDTSGRDVTDLPGLHDETDCEIVATNGTLSFWIRLPDGCVDWVRCRERSINDVVAAWVELGIDWFLMVEQEAKQ